MTLELPGPWFFQPAELDHLVIHSAAVASILLPISATAVSDTIGTTYESLSKPRR